MLQVCREKITDDIKIDESLTVQADKATDVSPHRLLVLVYCYEIDGKPVERYWGFMNLSALDAERISNELLSKLCEHLLKNPKKLIAQSYDGALVISGRVNGVQATIRCQHPYA